MKKIISLVSAFSCVIVFSFFCYSSHALEIEKLADDDWLLVRSQNFTIITDLNQEKGASLARDLESYRYFTIDMMGLKLLNVAKPLTVLAISSSSNFKRLELPENWAGVYSASGSPSDDGYLQSSFGQNTLANLAASRPNDVMAYRFSYLARLVDPGNYYPPRRIYLGLNFGF